MAETPNTSTASAHNEAEEISCDHHLEDEWRHAYDNCRERWKQHRQSLSTTSPAEMYFDLAYCPSISSQDDYQASQHLNDMYLCSLSVSNFKSMSASGASALSIETLAQHIAAEFSLNDKQR